MTTTQTLPPVDAQYIGAEIREMNPLLADLWMNPLERRRVAIVFREMYACETRVGQCLAELIDMFLLREEFRQRMEIATQKY